MSTVAPYQRAWKFAFNATITATNSVFVDSFAGDDLRGTGLKDFPFQTLNRAITFARSNSKTFVVARGYFSEEVGSGNYIYLLSDQMGDMIFDGKGMYNLNGVNIGHPGFPSNGLIVINVLSSLYEIANSIVNGIQYTNYAPSMSVLSAKAGVSFPESALLGSRSAYIGFQLINSRSSGGITIDASIYDGCKVFLDTNSSSSYKTYRNCLFRVNCTFWKRKDDGSGDERVDTDAMNAAQKYAAIMDWLNNGVVASGYTKNRLEACRITDNRIFNAPDNNDGYSWDYSLIYGSKETNPACYMNSGKHIGPFAPAIRIEFKYTDSLTTSPFEIEVKPTDKLTIENGRLLPSNDFTGAILYSKPMPIPYGTQFNGFNASILADAIGDGIFVNNIPDSIDMSEASKIDVTSSGVALESNKCYYVMADTGTFVNYDGASYGRGSVLMATSNALLAAKAGGGNAYLYPMQHPSIWQNVMFKIYDGSTVPADFQTNDVSYPYMLANMMLLPNDPLTDKETGLRCLRVGNLSTGAIDVGSDGRPLTNAHPEYYNATNQARPKFFVRANWVMLRIIISKIS